MSQPSTQMPNMGMGKVKTVVVANKWKSLFGFLIVVGVIVVLCLTIIPGAPIHKLIWPSPSPIKIIVPPNNTTQPSVSVLIAAPSM